MTAVSIGRSFGWLHEADGDRGVVMCAAMGYEALCAHQSWRILADRFAASGMPALRFDYPGEGDSLGDAAGDPAALDCWRQSIRDAIRWMRETGGVREIVLVGLRLGATLAAEAGGADHLVQLAPVIKGQSYVRELTIMSRMLAASGQFGSGRRQTDREIELEGFVTGERTLASLMGLDLTQLAAPPAERILVLAEPASRHAEAYARRLAEIGVDAEMRAFDGYDAMTPAPIPSPSPHADFDGVVDWAAKGWTRRARPVTAAVAPGVLSEPCFVERGVRFGADGALAGVLCVPLGAQPRATLVLLNTGANYHIGCGRSFVAVARAIAAKGVATLRMDNLGIGDSDPLAGGPRSVLYRQPRQADVRAALDFLEARGLRDFGIAGVCSGATMALLAAEQDTRVKGAALVNIQVFTNLSDESVIETRLNAAFGATSTYVAKAVSLHSWLRVVRGEVPLRKVFAIAGAMLRRKARVVSARTASVFGMIGSLHARQREAHANLESLSRRGVLTHLLYGDRDAGLEELTACFGPEGCRLRALPGITLEIVQGVDHAFSNACAREALLTHLGMLADSVASMPTSASNVSAGAVTATPANAYGGLDDLVEAVVCIPTFKRPEMLAATLASIEAQQTGAVFRVVVVDNDAESKQGLGVAESVFRSGTLKGITATEPQQGNVHAINAAFGLALKSYPSAQYFLMIDDDEVAEPMWLEEMITAARREKAAIVGGPVFPMFPSDVKSAFRDHPVYWPAISASGPVPMIFGTGNCLVTRRVFEAVGSPAFDPRFNFLGGGDTEFFTRCRKAGFKFYWRQEACIRERVTPNRLSLEWVLRRSIATGVINYRIDSLATKSLSDRAWLIAKNIAIAPVSLQRALFLLLDAKHPLAAFHPIGVAAGRWLASFGLDPQPYRHKTP